MIAMKNLFLTYLNAGVFGSVIILVVLLLRPIFRKVPRRILCALWLLVAIRLLLPFNIESQFSLQPKYEFFGGSTLEQQHQPDFAPPEELPNIEIPDVNLEPESPPQDIPVIPETPVPIPEAIPTHLDWGQILSVVWVTVLASILGYYVITYIVLKWRIRTAVQCEDGVMESEHISGAFLLGYLNPRIYLPMGLKEQDRVLILAHERIHIQRLDHWWKLLGVFCVAVHWYNPLVWIGYALMCRDIEITCDERVICSMDTMERKAYAQALLNSEKRRFGILQCPVAFGEVDLKQRIRNVLSYHPYGYWLTAFAVALVVFVAFCFLTSPATKQDRDSLLEMPATQATNPAVTNPTGGIPVTTNPTVTDPSVTDSPVTEPPVTEPPVTEPPVTNPPVTHPTITTIAYGTDRHGNYTFRLTDDGTLTIYRTEGYSSYDDNLWRRHADLVTRIVMREGCTRIEEDAFKNLDNLTEVYLCESLEEIGMFAFYGCDRLQSIRIPANVTTIGSLAFARCLGLAKVEFAPDSKLTEIGWSAFGNTAISSFIAPPNLKTVGRGAFGNCWRLETVILRGSIEVVEVDAFSGCTRLKHVVLGESVVQATYAFRDCGEIETVENYSKFPTEDLQ